MKICYNCFRETDLPANHCPYCGFPLNEGRDIQFPQALPYGSILNGQYITGRVLGQGGFGITYIAQDYNTKELVAIKEYFPGVLATRTGPRSVQPFSAYSNENFAFGKRIFLKEATTLSRFTGSPNIVRIHQFFEENGTAYFSMEYVKGESLKQYVQKKGGSLSWHEAEKIFLPVMEALEEVHAQGIIHRDIAPDNIAITEEGGVKLLDFGAARYSMGDRSNSLSVILKHGFAPKEQYSRHGNQGPWTDVYAMAATIYNVLTGEMIPDSIDRNAGDRLPPLSSRGVFVPEHVESALITALAVESEDRFRTMREFRDALTGKVIVLPQTEPEPEPFDPDSLVTVKPVDTEDDTGESHADTAGSNNSSSETVRIENKSKTSRKNVWKVGLIAGVAAFIVIILAFLIIPRPSPANTEEGITSGNFLNQGYFAMSGNDCYAYCGIDLYLCKNADLSQPDVLGDRLGGQFLNLYNGHLYYVEKYKHCISRCDLDGSNKIVVYDASSDTSNEPENLYIYGDWYYFSNHNKLFRGKMADLENQDKGPATKADCIIKDFNYENATYPSLCFIDGLIYYIGEKGLASAKPDGSEIKNISQEKGNLITDGEVLFSKFGTSRVSRILPDGSATQILNTKDIGKISKINYSDGWLYFTLDDDENIYLCRIRPDGSDLQTLDIVTSSNNVLISMNTFAGAGAVYFFFYEKDGEDLAPVSKDIVIPDDPSAETDSDNNTEPGTGGNSEQNSDTPSKENAAAYAQAYLDIFCGRDADLPIPFANLEKENVISKRDASLEDLIASMHTDTPPDDRYREHIKEFYIKAFSKASFTIDEVTESTENNALYSIHLTVTPVRIFYGQTERLKELTDSGVLNGLSQEEMTTIIEDNVYSIEYLDNPEYAESLTFTLPYVPLDGNSKLYGFDSATEQNLPYWFVNMQ